MSSPRPRIPLPSRAASALRADETERHQRDRTLTAADVYKDVWGDFYRWKSGNDARIMREFCVARPDMHSQRRTYDYSDGFDFDHWDSDHEYLSSYSPSSTATDEHDLDEEMSFLTFKDSSSTRPRFVITTYAYLPEELVDASDGGLEFELDTSYIPIKSAFGDGPVVPGMDLHLPHPCYFSCTPTSRNLPRDIQPNTLPFSPFEDNPSFDLLRYLPPFHGFLWQMDFIDPDIELIHLEAVRRLRYHFHFSFAQIDALPFLATVRITRASGLLWDTSQRDLLRWPGMQLSEIPELSLADLQTIPPKGDMFTDLANGMRGFCPNLNCVQTFCGVHREMRYPDLEPIKPLHTSSHLQLKKGNPCSDYCFRYIDLFNEFQLEAVQWENADDIKILHSILQVAPDILPCDLAIIMRAKCQDVFVYRSRFFPDENIGDDLNLDWGQNELSVYNDDPFSADSLRASAKFAALTPCKHKGPCNRDSGCQCFLDGHHCQRNCWCNPKCGIRWKGCRCAPEPGTRRRTCSTEQGCPCLASARECDPELCKRCDARGKKNKSICNNVNSQRAIYPLIEIKKGSWGLGAFTTQALRASQPVGEYVGEILPLDNDIHNSTAAIVSHTGLNYGFDLNKNVVLDSMYVGNETRYLNHEGPKSHAVQPERGNKTANCSGKVVYVNNQHRIMFYTERRVEAGSELFIDYGVEYWTAQDEWDAGTE